MNLNLRSLKAFDFRYLQRPYTKYPLNKAAIPEKPIVGGKLVILKAFKKNFVTGKIRKGNIKNANKENP